jgi:hypothetical protein
MESYAIDRLSPDSQVSEHQYCPELFGIHLPALRKGRRMSSAGTPVVSCPDWQFRVAESRAAVVTQMGDFTRDKY